MARLAAALVFAAAAGAAASAAAGQSAVPRALETFDEAWAIVNRTYYDPSFKGVDWDDVRDELRPEAARATSVDALRGVINGMLARLGDSHFAVLPMGMSGAADGIDRSGSPGFDVRPLEGSLLVTRVDEGTPAAKAGLKPGDRITAIGATPAASLVGDLPDSLEPRMRALEAWRAAMMALRGPAGSRVAVTAAAPGGGRANCRSRASTSRGRPCCSATCRRSSSASSARRSRRRRAARPASSASTSGWRPPTRRLPTPSIASAPPAASSSTCAAIRAGLPG